MAEKKTSFLQQLQIIHIMLVGGAAGFVGVLAFIVGQGGGAADEDTGRLLLIIAAAIASSTAFGFVLIKRSLLGKLSPDQPLATRQNAYRTAMLIQLAMMEGAVLVSGLSYLMGGQTLSLILAVVFMGAMFFLRPTRDRVMTEAHISRVEMDAN